METRDGISTCAGSLGGSCLRGAVTASSGHYRHTAGCVGAWLGGRLCCPTGWI